MGLDPIALAIPVFFGAIGVELAVARRQGLAVARWNDAIADLGCGVVEQVGSIFLRVLFLAPYFWVYDHARIATLSGPVAWVVAMIGVDLAYYWWHRISHRVNFMWAIHGVHHQSEDYNLSVALRQAVFGGLTSWPLDLPLAILGVPPLTFLGSSALNLLYQFWVHTRTIDRMGVLDRFLDTPSNHRVHHGVNRRYLDKNYAGILLFDRWFGTWQPEDAEPVYGTVSPTSSWDPVWAQFSIWAKIADLSRQMRGFDKVRVWFMPPEWRPAYLPAVDFPGDDALATRPRYDVDGPPGLHAYVAVQYAFVAGGVAGLLLVANDLPLVALAAPATLIVAALVALAGLFEGKPWAVGAEVGRLLATAAWGAFAVGAPWGWLATLPALAAAATIGWRRAALPRAT